MAESVVPGFCSGYGVVGVDFHVGRDFISVYLFTVGYDLKRHLILVSMCLGTSE